MGVLLEAKRKGSLDSNLVKGSLTPTDRPGFILDHPNLNRFVFAANSTGVFRKKGILADWLATGEAKTNTTATSTENVENLDDQSCDVTVKKGKTRTFAESSNLSLRALVKEGSLLVSGLLKQLIWPPI